MERVLTTTRFLVSTAVCCGLSVALAIWAAGGGSGGARVLAALIGLTASFAVMLLIAAAASGETPVAPVAEPPVEAAAPRPRVSEGHDVLARRLDEGRALQEQLQPGSTDPRVDAWIDEARTAIERSKPGVAGYFDALAQRSHPDDGARLDAHVRRLETIVRGY